LISNAVGTQIIQVNKASKEIGKTDRRGNIAEFRFPACPPCPFLVSNRRDNMLALVVVIVVDDLITSFPCSVGVQEKEAFYRPL